MAKLDKIDTTQVPHEITAPWVKRFFKDHFGIPIRVRNAGNLSRFIGFRIQPESHPNHRHGIVYKHHFPAELGNRCLRIVYPNSEQLCSQDWAGNVQEHSISMLQSEFRQLVREIIVENTVPA